MFVSDAERKARTSAAPVSTPTPHCREPGGGGTRRTSIRQLVNSGMIRVPKMRSPFLCALPVAWSGAAAPALAAGGGSVAPRSSDTPIVSAFYYPWFATSLDDGTYAHWAQDGHSPPNDIASVYYPALGV